MKIHHAKPTYGKVTYDRTAIVFEAYARIFYNTKFVMVSGDASDGWRN